MVLEKLTSSNDIKQLNINDLTTLCEEIRDEIINTVNFNGGHLSSNLGSVELIVALLYVFDFTKDKIIFDVGHQCYAYKILTNRFTNFNTIRCKDGLSGFPDPNESHFDAFSVGHAGTSISAGLGYAYSRDSLNEDYYIINLVGDASIFNGENLEALTANEIKPKKFIVILNDNGMSIGKNNNGLYKLISKITVKKNYNNFNNFLSKTIGNSFIGRGLKKFKKFIKRSLSVNTITDNIGLKYVGQFDGHNLKTLINILNDIKLNNNATLLHTKTIKGKGLDVAEKNASKFHGVGKNLSNSLHTFSNSISEILEEVLIVNSNITTITAGMCDGVGLNSFANNHPDKFIDVGIAEEYAVTLSAGISKGGIIPIVFIYSTFLQRAYDQIVHDVCLQNLPVIFCIDRSGLVGNDGKTHQGVFDTSYLSHIPNLTIIAPKDVNELKQALLTALKLNSPVAIKYPNGNYPILDTVNELTNGLKWETLTTAKKNVILACGARMVNLALLANEKSGNKISVINARTIKPLDKELLLSISNKNIITLEDNVLIGGFGSLVNNFYNENKIKVEIHNLGVKDEYISHASVDEQLEYNDITIKEILLNIK